MKAMVSLVEEFIFICSFSGIVCNTAQQKVLFILKFSNIVQYLCDVIIDFCIIC